MHVMNDPLRPAEKKSCSLSLFGFEIPPFFRPPVASLSAAGCQSGESRDEGQAGEPAELRSIFLSYILSDHLPGLTADHRYDCQGVR